MKTPLDIIIKTIADLGGIDKARVAAKQLSDTAKKASEQTAAAKKAESDAIKKAAVESKAYNDIQKKAAESAKRLAIEEKQAAAAAKEFESTTRNQRALMAGQFAEKQKELAIARQVATADKEAAAAVKQAASATVAAKKEAMAVTKQAIVAEREAQRQAVAAAKLIANAEKEAARQSATAAKQAASATVAAKKEAMAVTKQAIVAEREAARQAAAAAKQAAQIQTASKREALNATRLLAKEEKDIIRQKIAAEKQAAIATRQAAQANAIAAKQRAIADKEAIATRQASSFGGIATAAYSGYLAAAAAISGVVLALKNLVTAGMEDERMWTGLKMAVESTGVAYDTVSGQAEGLIQKLQSTTRYGDDQLVPALQRMTYMTNDFALAQQMLPLAANMAESGLFDLEGASRAIGQALEGNVMQLGKAIPEIRSMAAELPPTASKAELVSKVFEILNTMFADQATKANDTGKQLAIFNTQMGNIKETIAGQLLPSINSLLKGMNDLLTVMVNKGPIEGFWDSMKQGIQDSIDKLKNFDVGEIVKNLGSVMATGAFPPAMIANIVRIAKGGAGTIRAQEDALTAGAGGFAGGIDVGARALDKLRIEAKATIADTISNVAKIKAAGKALGLSQEEIGNQVLAVWQAAFEKINDSIGLNEDTTKYAIAQIKSLKAQLGDESKKENEEVKLGTQLSEQRFAIEKRIVENRMEGTKALQYERQELTRMLSALNGVKDADKERVALQRDIWNIDKQLAADAEKLQQEQQRAAEEQQREAQRQAEEQRREQERAAEEARRVQEQAMEEQRRRAEEAAREAERQAEEAKRRAEEERQNRIEGAKSAMEERLVRAEMNGMEQNSIDYGRLKISESEKLLDILKREGVEKREIMSLELDILKLKKEQYDLENPEKEILAELNKQNNALGVQAQIQRTIGQEYDVTSQKINNTIAALEKLRSGEQTAGTQAATRRLNRELEQLGGMKQYEEAMAEATRQAEAEAAEMQGMLSSAISTGFSEGSRAGIKSLMENIKQSMMKKMSDMIASAIMGGFQGGASGGAGMFGGMFGGGGEPSEIGAPNTAGAIASAMSFTQGGGAGFAGMGAGGALPALTGGFAGMNNQITGAATKGAGGGGFLGKLFGKGAGGFMGKAMPYLGVAMLLGSLFGKKGGGYAPESGVAGLPGESGNINRGDLSALRGSRFYFSARNRTGNLARQYAALRQEDNNVNVEISMNGDAQDVFTTKVTKGMVRSGNRGNPNSRTGFSFG